MPQLHREPLISNPGCNMGDMGFVIMTVCGWA